MTLQLTPDDTLSGPTFSYEQLLGLREPPFALTANPRFLFESRAYTATVAEVQEALRRHEPIVVVTGAAGTGKTMVAKVLKEMHGSEFLVAVVSTPPDNADDLLRAILDQLGTMPRDNRRAAEISRFELLRTLEQFLRSLIPLRATAALVVDEAHRLSDATLEQLRSLSNLEIDDRKLLQIVLLAEPQFEARLNGPLLGPLRQRVTRLHTLNSLAAGEVRSYIERRLAVAKGSELLIWPFEDDAIDTIATLSNGLPRLVNVLCDRALEVACAWDVPRADRRVVLEAARHLHLTVPVSLTLRDRKRSVAVIAAVAALVALAAGVGWALATRPTLTHDLVAFVRGKTSGAPIALPTPAATAHVEPKAVAPVSSPSDAGNAGASGAVAPAAATGAPVPKGNAAESFTVLAASFRTPDRADAVAADFRKRGLPTRVRITDSGWHQVLIGPYATRSEAQEARQGLDAAFHDATIVAGDPAANTGAPSPAPKAVSESPAAPPAAPAAQQPASASSRGSASAPSTGDPAAPTTIDAAMKRAEAMALVPDVHGLIELRSSIAVSNSTSPDLERALARVDVLLDQARQRQLENDARQLQQGRGRGR